jgi:hypothetical protein
MKWIKIMTIGVTIVATALRHVVMKTTMVTATMTLNAESILSVKIQTATTVAMNVDVQSIQSMNA